MHFYVENGSCCETEKWTNEEHDDSDAFSDAGLYDNLVTGFDLAEVAEEKREHNNCHIVSLKR